MNNENIDELLNSYIDGELTQAQRTEVEHLIINDKTIGKRLNEIERCKMLVSSLPIAEAPGEMLEDINKLIEKRSLLGESSEYFDNRKGARQLVYRKLITAAAMIILVAVLGVMIYTVVIPHRLINEPLAFQSNTEFNKTPQLAANTDLNKDRLIGKVEFRANNLIAVNSAVLRAIKDNSLRLENSSEGHSDKSVYVIRETPARLSSFIADLTNVWTKLDGATLSIKRGGDESILEWVSANQLENVLKQATAEQSIKLAKEYAVINNSTDKLTAKDAFERNKEGAGSDLLSIPKPVLTGREKDKQIEYPSGGEKMDLTIVVIGTK